ncbi:MAG: DUF2357 domain-containing protein [Candidatus Egerieousia sp.]|nr:DUF2357 domain-containing protein [Candidatus Egerieousia sp.]
MVVEQLTIKVKDQVTLLIYSMRREKANCIFDADDALANGESRWQLVEGQEYDYELLEGEQPAANWFIEGPDVIFYQNKRCGSRGKIQTGIYVGTLSFQVRNKISGACVPMSLEIRSSKTGYRDDYRKMMNDITQCYTELVMQQGSPVSQTFDVAFDAPQKTLYQKFAFVRSIIDTDNFDESIYKIISSPVRNWTETTSHTHIESVKRVSRSMLKQIVTATDRILVSNAPYGLASLPRKIETISKTDTINTNENQFVKFVLLSFYSFCSTLASKRNATVQLKHEIDGVCDKLANFINNDFFKQISSPSHLNIGSPVLQRKEGYREILQDWLMFDLAAKITWKGGDNVYEAGKKNVAVLYEYWLFFKLKDIVSEVFKVKPEENKNLITLDNDGINLDIKQGKMNVINGKYDTAGRTLNVRFFYNRTFGFTEVIDKPGSWTMPLRPDYTLSIWPGDIKEEKAEEMDLIVHIHFDAKYRLQRINIDGLEDGSHSEQEELDKEKENRQVDIYKRGDLLKMHAYKDAIHRTGGAYVLYPGDKTKKRRGFHEIIPGLGAFCVSPSKEEEQLKVLSDFIRDVVRHFLDRTSQREKIAVANHMIHSISSKPFTEPFPEPRNLESFPDTIPVLVGCYKNKKHFEWICNNQKYNIRLGGLRKGAVEINTPLVNAKYLLLYDFKTKKVVGLFKIMGTSPSIITTEKMKQSGYPNPIKEQLYMVFSISEDSVEPEIKNIDWTNYIVSSNNGAPKLMTFAELFHSMKI